MAKWRVEPDMKMFSNRGEKGDMLVNRVTKEKEKDGKTQKEEKYS